jgi:hypothetical protein
MSHDLAVLIDEIAEIYHELRDRQRVIVFGTRLESEAHGKRIEALGYVTDALRELLKKHGYPEQILYSPKDLDEQGYRKIYDFLNDKLEEIQEELQDAVNRKYGKSKTKSLFY